jgi:hypothetical protein
VRGGTAKRAATWAPFALKPRGFSFSRIVVLLVIGLALAALIADPVNISTGWTGTNGFVEVSDGRITGDRHRLRPDEDQKCRDQVTATPSCGRPWRGLNTLREPRTELLRVA